MPASATLINSEEDLVISIEHSPDVSENQASGTEELPIEGKENPEEELVGPEEVPQQLPEESKPVSEMPMPTEPPKDEGESVSALAPDQSYNQGNTPGSVQPAPVENKRPVLQEHYERL